MPPIQGGCQLGRCKGTDFYEQYQTFVHKLFNFRTLGVQYDVPTSRIILVKVVLLLTMGFGLRFSLFH